MKRLLSNPTGERKQRKLRQSKVKAQQSLVKQSIESTPSNDEEMTKEDFIKILELLRTSSLLKW